MWVCVLMLTMFWYGFTCRPKCIVVIAECVTLGITIFVVSLVSSSFGVLVLVLESKVSHAEPGDALPLPEKGLLGSTSLILGRCGPTWRTGGLCE